MKRYKLLKDLPTFRAGDIFVLANDGCLYLTDNEDGKYCGMSMGGHWKKNVMAYHKNTLQHFPNILEDWFEEVKEPAGWRIAVYGGISRITKNDKPLIPYLKEIGNYFETKEEAELAVEKLKAWKRLKDKGFRFDGYDVAHNGAGDLCGQVFYNAGKYSIEDIEKDLDLLLGGEE